MGLLAGIAAVFLVYVGLAGAIAWWGWRASAALGPFWLRCVARAAVCAFFTAPSFLLGGERGFPVPACIGLVVSLVTWDSLTGLAALKWLGLFWAGWMPVVALPTYLGK